MKNTNYQKQLDILLEQIKKTTRSVPPVPKPSLLLHACCGPCSSYVLEYLCSYFNITVYYYNPNIYPQSEYERRLNELKDFYTKFPPVLNNNIIIIEENYNPDDFYNAINLKKEPFLADEKEKGERCCRCYDFRLRKAYEYAVKHNYDYYCTTLSISPFKDADKINLEGIKIAQDNNPSSTVKWLMSDFKKKNGFKRSLELSEEYNLYRQQYCGCIYSLKQIIGK